MLFLRVAKHETVVKIKVSEGWKAKLSGNLPGSFFVRNDAFVIIDFDTVTTVVAGVSATDIPIGPSLGWPFRGNKKLIDDDKVIIWRDSLTWRIGLQRIFDGISN